MRKKSCNFAFVKEIVRSIVLLGIPIIVGQLGTIAQQFADTIMVGHYGTDALAAAGLVNNIFNLVIFFILGISYASTPIIGSAFGSGNKRGVVQSLVESVIVNFSVSLVVVAGLSVLYLNIEVLHQPDEILPLVKPYFLTLLLSVPFMAVFNALKQFSDAIGETKMPMWLMLASNLLNILLNWLLIFGVCGFPRLGLLGAGIATLLSRIFCLVALAAAIFYGKRYKCVFGDIGKGISVWRVRPAMPGMRHVLFVGLPISIQLGLEASSFNISAIFMGWIGAIALAAHQVMSTIATLCFQVIYGIGAAASVLISQSRGADDWVKVRRIATSAFFLSLGVIVTIMTLIYVMREPLVRCFTDSEEVVAASFALLPCFFLYQFGDTTQIVFANALRGLERVKRMMLYAFIAYVMVSIPLSYFFAFVMQWGSVGVWMGMPFGLSTAGILFFLEFRRGVGVVV